MKKYLVVFAGLLFLSSCIKVETVSLCSSVPASPVLLNPTIDAPSNLFTASVTNPASTLTYTWIAPGLNYYNQPITYTGSTIHANTVYGTWSVIAANGPCTSDTTKFLVIPTNPNCVGLDSLEFGVGGYFKLGLQNTYNNVAQNGYYQISFGDINGDQLNIFFPQLPTTSGIYSIQNNNDFFGESTAEVCSINFITTGNNFNTGNGSVYVIVNGSNVTMAFCSVTFGDMYGNNINLSGNFVGH